MLLGVLVGTIAVLVGELLGVLVGGSDVWVAVAVAVLVGATVGVLVAVAGSDVLVHQKDDAAEVANMAGGRIHGQLNVGREVGRCREDENDQALHFRISRATRWRNVLSGVDSRSVTEVPEDGAPEGLTSIAWG